MTAKPLQVIYDDVYLTDYPTASCETPERVSAIMAVLRKHYPVMKPEPASEEDVLRVHTRSVLKEIQADPGLYQAAITAAGGAILAANLALKGQPAFAAVRPPGHHASPASYWGFCFFNNVAVSIEGLLRRKAIFSALVLDIDLHFGDGTNNFFTGRPQVTVANIQDNDRGRFLQNVDLALSANEYDIIAISAGFDRHVQDWGGTLTTEDYFTIGRAVCKYAETRCEGRYYAVLEGGYNTEVLGENALALCKGMDPAS
ncbi:MAG: histone deacetylase family protein [Desulfomonile tiedjei]|nr:histone deacetylase family protein [Desulfomonile tiedjei]